MQKNVCAADISVTVTLHDVCANILLCLWFHLCRLFRQISTLYDACTNIANSYCWLRKTRGIIEEALLSFYCSTLYEPEICLLLPLGKCLQCVIYGELHLLLHICKSFINKNMYKVNIYIYLNIFCNTNQQLAILHLQFPTFANCYIFEV